MRITELIKKETITLNLKARNKEQVIDELVNKLHSAKVLADKELFKKEIWKREKEYSTGIGEGIAIPHAKTKAVKKPALAFGVSREGVEYDSLDGEKVNIVFMIAASEGANNEHLDTLSRLSTMLMNPDFKAALLNAKSEEEVVSLIDKTEAEFLSKETKESIGTTGKFIVAVTACPTGIAHTYMAADAIKNKGREMGIGIKVETNGSTGAKNVLTDEEIARAAGVIVAADKQVEMDRFDGKRVIEVPVVQGMKNPEGLINRILKGDAPVYKAKDSGSKGSDVKVKKGFYKHLMNGVSNMLPFVVGGGILIAICFMFGIKAFDPEDPSYNSFAKLLMDIGGGNAFKLMIPVLAGFIGMSIADRPGFAPAMVGGLIAANSGAGFLGGLIAGFLGGYVVVLLKKVFEFMPESLEGLKPVLLYPLFGIFITGAVMLLVVVDPVTAMNKGLENWLNSLGTSNMVLLGIVLGGMMAIDMGGPVNKAAYTFGLAMIAAGNNYPHAAIMAGGMVPPLGIALATTLFRNKFTKEERDAGKTCYIMGLSFITEGAIPFAAADPIRVLASCIAGSAVAGGLSMAFKVALPAPHGGLFVLPVVSNKIPYLIAILAGTLVTTFLLGALKKNIKSS